MNIFNIPEVVVRIFPFLSTEDRAHNRLINSTFDAIYQTEEKNDLIDKWHKYCQELAHDYDSPVLSNEQLTNLINQFGFTNMQFHLKVWLTNCASGRYHFSNLISIAPVDDWEFIAETPISEHSTFPLILNSEFGENQWQENLIMVHKGHFTSVLTLLDKRNGLFFIFTGTSMFPSLKCIGHIKDWIESIPIHVIKPISLFGNELYPDEEMIGNMTKYVKIMQEGDKKDLVEFLKANANFYPYLSIELRRDPEILGAVKKMFETDPDCYFQNIPAFFPSEIRKDKDAYFDLFNINSSHIFLHHSLRKDKDFTIRLMKQYPYSVDPNRVQTEFVNDPEVAKHWVYTIDLKESAFKIKTKEDILRFLQVTLDVESVEPELLNNLTLMVEVINQHFHRNYKTNEYLEDRDVILEEISNRNVIFLSIASPELRNNREFMLECIEINEKSALFIGDSLKNDVKILANPTALTYVSGLQLTMNQILEILRNMENDDIDYAMNYNAVKNFIPAEYLKDDEFMLHLLEISAFTNVLMSSKLRKDKTFWSMAFESNQDLLKYGVVPIDILREKYPSDLSNIDPRLLTYKMRDDKTVIENSGGEIFNYASERVRSDKDLLLECMERYSSVVYLYAPKHLRKDTQIKQALSCPSLLSIPDKLPSRFAKQ
ncbi:predicted protein [Naegleria gruberi]|uniref:Predicted protein n=1 Tax=Naegleria gruberi TaxID=5762 RepID=D2VQV2_NAEGR|nr:uncharacterized protein NAEGRDRAFT_71357 [Naegleria gruberi]EFC40775.1 predicted protein [Naegleria gruberi]|eukprot:XP_002673519.1 predicted protein [Naegleria gruberi strain NEG-M]